ncbi:MAG: heavy metal transporter [Methylibium sp. NZG]|nr:MAG: heavy metal transporter [Methylibium sp. NZG]
MNKLLTSLACVATMTMAIPSHAVETAKLTVNGMVCAFCAQGIEKRVSALPATQAIHVDLAGKVVAVEARPGQTLDLAKITAEITEAGYAVTKAEMVNQSVEQIRAEKKAKK